MDWGRLPQDFRPRTAGELRAREQANGCVPQSSRTLAATAHWPDPSFRAAVNLSLIPTSRSSGSRGLQGVAVRATDPLFGRLEEPESLLQGLPMMAAEQGLGPGSDDLAPGHLPPQLELDTDGRTRAG